MLNRWLALSLALTIFSMQASEADTSSLILIESSNSIVSDVDANGDDQTETPAPTSFESPAPCMLMCNSYAAERLVEFKVGYFFFSNSKMRKIYDRGGIDIQLSLTYPVWKWFHIYGSLEYLKRSGKSLAGGQHTSIYAVPLSLGVKPVIRITDRIHYYATLGPRYVFVQQHNISAFVDKHAGNSNIGGFVNTGFTFFPLCHLCVDIFGEYSYVKIHAHPSETHVEGRNIQVGGFVFGGSLGYSF